MLVEYSETHVNRKNIQDAWYYYSIFLLVFFRCEAVSASDYVEFSNYMTEDNRYGRYCGQMKEFHVESERNFFKVTFRSNDRLDGTGFKAIYQFLEVTDEYRAPIQDLASSSACK